jgi:hypothetical protein
MLRELLTATALAALISAGPVFAQGAGQTVPLPKAEPVKSETLIAGVWGTPTTFKTSLVEGKCLVAGVWGSPTTEMIPGSGEGNTAHACVKVEIGHEG